MIKRTLFLLSIFFCSLSLFSSNDRYDGTYTLQMKFNEGGYSYKYNECYVKIENGIAKVGFDYKMTQAKSAATNYVMVFGKGSGTFTGNALKATGSGTISTYEKGVNDDVFNLTFTMNGTCVTNDEGTKLSGSFEFNEDGQPVSGVFTGICKREETEQVDAGCKFSSMNGQVEIKIPGSNVWKLAKLSTNIPVGAHIKTADESSAILSFSDMSTFVLKPETEIILESPPQKESKLELITGKIWLNIKKTIETGTMDVDMNQAVLGDKGTIFICEDDGTTSTVKVIEGLVDFKSKTTGKHMDVITGEKISATQSGLGAKTTFDAASETADWDKYNKISLIDKILASPLYIAIAVASILLIIGFILFFIFRKRKVRKPIQQQYAYPGNAAYPPQYTQQQPIRPVIPPVVKPVQNILTHAKPGQFCTSCGALLKPEAKFCHKCAKPVIRK